MTLKQLAHHLKLSPATVSAVLNDSPVAKTIAAATKQRIRKAVAELNYRPNHYARGLSKRRSHTIGVLLPEISEGYGSLVMCGIEETLLKRGYCYLVASHHHQDELVERYPAMLAERAVEGLLFVDTPVKHPLSVPAVSVSGHRRVRGLGNILLDHDLAAELALRHLTSLGHRDIAFIKGQSFSSDTEVRWNSNAAAARRFGLEVRPEWVVQLKGDSSSPILGFGAVQQMLANAPPPTAIFAFNDVSAIGATRALREFSLDVPEDVSVIGFDDIQSAAFQNPALTTIRQPLREMGAAAAELLLARIEQNAPLTERVFAPELIVRESTAVVKAARHLNPVHAAAAQR